MKIAYFDCFAGAGGDMILGALLDAGLPLEKLRSDLDRLGLDNFDLQVEKVRKKGIAGSQLIIRIAGEKDGHHQTGHPHHAGHTDHTGHTDHSAHDSHAHHVQPLRRLSDILHIIEKSSLDSRTKCQSMAIFQNLARAEAKVHGIGLEEVHFHEVGAMDTIIDVVGAVCGITAMGIEKIFCSPLHTGCGTVRCAHGVLPIPAPATAELIQGKPVYATGVKGELLTPTGAAILTGLSDDFGPMPAMRVEKCGYGAGNADPEIPNLLRVIIGEREDIGARQNRMDDYESDAVTVMEMNLDDADPQIYDYLMEKILGMGAKDIFLTPVQMKKNRPGILLTLLCAPEDTSRFADFLLRETPGIGLRLRREKRIKVRREIRTFSSSLGDVRVKIAEIRGEIINYKAEYEDCKAIALEKNMPIKQVMEIIRGEMAGQEYNRPSFKTWQNTAALSQH
ncbi:MAG: nickel pincer cofactor biosynthesis protein LarC [Desulfococcaceae bacterium]|nr:nickel pincer cofactor biosynthesis protein LarC [Desulfococcaceae bacterium]